MLNTYIKYFVDLFGVVSTNLRPPDGERRSLAYSASHLTEHLLNLRQHTHALSVLE
jgi:hypothetical protein